MAMKLADLTIPQVKSVACPLCRAEAGHDCKYAYMGASRDGLHKQRRKAAREMLETAPARRIGRHQKL